MRRTNLKYILILKIKKTMLNNKNSEQRCEDIDGENFSRNTTNESALENLGLKHKNRSLVENVASETIQLIMCQEALDKSSSPGIAAKGFAPSPREKLQCVKCNSNFKSRDSFTNHQRRKTPCHVRNNHGDLLKHFYTKLEPSDARFNPKAQYMCNVCQSLFKSPSNLKVHVESVHLGRKPYSCDQCGSAFTTKCSRQRHIDVTHKKLKHLQCHHCGKEFASGQALKYHTLRKHDTVRQFACHLCAKMFKTPNEVSQHNRKLHRSSSFQCHLCGIVQKSRDSLRKHFSEEHKLSELDKAIAKPLADLVNAINNDSLEANGDSMPVDLTKTNLGFEEKVESGNTPKWRKPFCCNFCNSDFAKLSAAQSHVEINHLNIQKFQCGHCGTKFLRKNHLKAHTLAKHSKPPSIIFLEDDTALKHIEQKANPKVIPPRKFKCEDCDNRFTRKDHLKSHIIAKHSVKDLKSENVKTMQTRVWCNQSNDEEDYLTNKSMQIGDLLDQNNISDYDENVSDSENTQKEKETVNVPGDNCSTVRESDDPVDDLKSFYQKMDPKDPRYSQKSRYVCLKCDSLFKSPSNIKVHVLSVHLSQKSFKCNHCSLQFVTNSILQSHIKNTHLQPKSIQCHLCGTSFTSAQALRYHVFRIHDTIRRFPCEQCDKKFKAPVELSHHMKRIHDKSTKIQCDQCGTVLSSKDYLKKHILTVHQNQRRFECEVCHKQFTQKSAMITHKMTVHEKRKEHKCGSCARCFGTAGALAKHLKAKPKNVCCKVSLN